MAIEYLLHIDTSGPTGKVLLAAGGVIIAARRNEAEREHAGTINGMIDEVMQEAGADLQDLAAVAVCSGPGSYTGLRIGLATAKGICYAVDKPLIMHNKLELLADCSRYDRMLCLLPARTGEYFMAVYERNGNTIMAPKHAMREEVIRELINNSSIVVTGNVEKELGEYLEKHPFFYTNEIDEQVWLKSGLLNYKNKDFKDVDKAEPMYLKQVFIYEKKN